MTASRLGTTLVEMMVAITILALVAAVVAGSVRASSAPSEMEIARETMATTRRAAIDGGTSTTTTLHLGDSSYAATAFPDGRILTRAPIGVAMLTGRRDDARP